MSGRTGVAQGQGFVEVSDRCWVARYELLDVNVGVVAGERGLLVVDTQASEAAARTVVDDVRRLARGDVVAVVNTHQHFDHCFGNVVFLEEYDGVDLLSHEAAATGLRETATAVQQEAARSAADPDEPEQQRQAQEIAATRVRVPERTFSSAHVVDLGDRLVEVVHPGRGHTAGDAVVHVPDGQVVFAGDLVEESVLRNRVPGFGDDCFPLEWPASLDLVMGLLSPDSVVVPGHGRPVDRAFVQRQHEDIVAVAETIRRLAGEGVSADEALAQGEWPYPVEELRHAVRRGYAQLPSAGRSLPLA